MKDQVAEQIKTLRSNELLQLEHRMSKEYREYYMDKPVEVLMEEPVEINGKRYFTGYTKRVCKSGIRNSRRYFKHISNREDHRAAFRRPVSNG